MNKLRSKPHPKASYSDFNTRNDPWSILQIMAEFVHGHEALSHIPPSVSIFGSARTEETHPYYKMTQKISRKLSEAGFSIVTGGGPGIMAAGNHGASEGPSLSVGLNVELPFEETSNSYQDIRLRFRHFFSRKSMFIEYASAYIFMPGGYGTLDELSEVLVLIQTAKTKKVPAIMIGTAFWEGLIQWFKTTLIPEGMINPEDVDLFHVTDDLEEAVQRITESIA